MRKTIANTVFALGEMTCKLEDLCSVSPPSNIKSEKVSANSMKDYKEINIALKKFLTSLKELKRLGLTTNRKDFTSQIGEWLVSEIFEGRLADSAIQQYWDIKFADKYIQVKTHSKSATTTARWSEIKYDENAPIDELIIIVFTPDYKLKEFYKTPWSEVLKLIRKQKHRDVIQWDDLIKYKIEIDDLPKQELISLFK